MSSHIRTLSTRATSPSYSASTSVLFFLREKKKEQKIEEEKKQKQSTANHDDQSRRSWSEHEIPGPPPLSKLSRTLLTAPICTRQINMSCTARWYIIFSLPLDFETGRAARAQEARRTFSSTAWSKSVAPTWGQMASHHPALAAVRGLRCADCGSCWRIFWKQSMEVWPLCSSYRRGVNIFRVSLQIFIFYTHQHQQTLTCNYSAFSRDTYAL